MLNTALLCGEQEDNDDPYDCDIEDDGPKSKSINNSQRGKRENTEDQLLLHFSDITTLQ